MHKKYLDNILWIIALLASIAMTGCYSWHPVVVNPYLNAKSEIIIRPELQELLDKNGQNLKIVLRVPAMPPQVSQADIIAKNKLYDIIERALYKAGFTVRDRALLEKVLQGEIGSYREVADKIDTDIILEIISLETGIKLSHRFYYDPSTDTNEKLADTIGENQPGPVFTLYGGKLDARIITVKDGSVTGIMTIYGVPYSAGFQVLTPAVAPMNIGAPGYTGFGIGDEEEAVQFMSGLVVQTLLGCQWIIKSVTPGSIADYSGLKPGDEVIEVNGNKVYNFSYGLELLRNSWDYIDLKIKRQGAVKNIEIEDYFGQLIGLEFESR